MRRNRSFWNQALLRIKILYRYIGREYVVAFAAVLGLCSLLIGLNIYFEKFDDIAAYSPPLRDVIAYVLYGLPVEVLNLMPQIALLAVLFGIGILSKNNEVLAMHACGVSYTRLGFPVMVCAALVSLGSLLLSETVVPECAMRQASADLRIKKKQPDTEKRQYEPTGEWVYLTDLFDVKRRTMTRPTIYRMTDDGQRIVWKISADSARLVKFGKSDDTWRFENATTWNYTKEGNPASSAVIKPVKDVHLPKKLDRLLGPEKKPEQMNFSELLEHIRVLQENGENAFKYTTDLQKKLAFPFSTFILTLIGYTIAVRAHVRPLVVGFSYGLAAGIIYYLIDAVFSKFGHEGVMNNMVAAWTPNVAFLLFALYRLQYVNQVRD